MNAGMYKNEIEIINPSQVTEVKNKVLPWGNRKTIAPCVKLSNHV
jgi:hypothetical protein